jgi:hypothetical protein
MMSRKMVILLVAVVAIISGGIGYAAAKMAGGNALASVAQPPRVQPTQLALPDTRFPFPGLQPGQQIPGPDQFQVPGQAPGQIPAPGQPPQIREFVPLPGPGQQMPGQQPQQQDGQCEPIILFYYNGKLYQLKPGPGPQNGPGRPGTPPEFFYLNPYQGPAIPGLPIPPQGPGFAPVNPRS